LPSPEPLAVLGAICRPSELSEPCPEALAVLIGVLNEDSLDEPTPAALAALRLEWSMSASSLAVAPPDADAVLSFPYLNNAYELDWPDAEPLLKMVRNSCEVEEPLPFSEIVLKNVLFS
jgi:hypothetical protein